MIIPRWTAATKPYAIFNRYSVELPPGMEEGEGYVRQLQTAGELWRLAVYEDTYDSKGTTSTARPPGPAGRSGLRNLRLTP